MKIQRSLFYPVLLLTLSLISAVVSASVSSSSRGGTSEIIITNLSSYPLQKTSGPWNAPNTIAAGGTETISLQHSFIVIDETFEVTYERVGGTGGCEFSSRLYMVEAGSYYVPAYESSSNRVGGGSSCMDRLSNEKWSEPYQYTATFTVY